MGLIRFSASLVVVRGGVVVVVVDEEEVVVLVAVVARASDWLEQMGSTIRGSFFCLQKKTAQPHTSGFIVCFFNEMI